MLEFVVLNPPRKKRRSKKTRARKRQRRARDRHGRFLKKASGKKTTRKKARRKASSRKTATTSKARRTTVARTKRSATSRSRAAKRAAATRRRNAAARSAAARKAARTRKRRHGTTRKRRRRSNPRGGLWSMSSAVRSERRALATKRRSSKRRRKRGHVFRGKTYRPVIRRRRPVKRKTYQRIRAAARGRRRANPGFGGLRGFTRQLRSVFTVNTAIGVGQGLLGASLALTLPPYLAKWTRQPSLDSGYLGVLSSAIASVLAAGAAASLGFRSAAPRILAGALLATGSKALKLILPSSWASWIPSITVNGSSATALRALPGTAGLRGVRGVRGLGRAMSSEQLIAGEARAQGMGDFLTMSGMRVPRASIAGIGLGDYMYFQQYPQAASPIGIPEFSPPTGEQF